MARDVQAERAAIDAAIEGRTLCDLLARNAVQHGDRPALHWQDGGGWQSSTWREYRERAADLALGLASLGVRKGDFVAIMAANRPEHFIADAGAMHVAATAVSIYNTLAPEQIAYVVGDCGAKVAIVENLDFLKRWQEVRDELPNVEHVILIEGADGVDDDWVVGWDEVMDQGAQARADDSEAFDASVQQVDPEQPATLIYTSGTTGPPKGVIITHRNVLWELESVERYVNFPLGAKSISYLPLAHIAERLFSYYIGLQRAGQTYFCPDVTKAIEVVNVARPWAFLAVPRVWEKVQAGILAKVDAEEDQRKRRLALKAIETGRQAVRQELVEGRPLGLGLKLKRALLDKLVLSKVRAGIGLDRCELAVSGAAPIATDVLEFFAGIGLPINEAYGMTETTAVTNANRPGEMKIGTVGQALPGVEVELAEDGEVVARGGNIMAGYYNQPEATAESIDPDGWLHTGDLGEMDEHGYLRIVGRKKEIIITAGGKNIAPDNIESLIKQHTLIGQVCVVGDQRRFVSALIVLDAETAPAWAEKNGVPFSDLDSFSKDERVHAEVQEALDQANQRLASAEQPKKFTILPEEWTAESEELTPTMKLKRSVIHRKYADEIEAMYAE